MHRPHGVVAAKIAAIGQIEAVKWDVGLTSELTLLLAAIAEVRYSPFYTCGLAFETLAVTKERVVIKTRAVQGNWQGVC